MISWQWLLGKNWQKAKKVLAEENTTLNSLNSNGGIYLMLITL